MISSYLPRDTLIYRLDIRTKVLGFSGLILLVFIFQDPIIQILLLAPMAFLIFSLKLPFKKIRTMIVPLIPIFITIFLFTSFSYTPDRFERASSKIVLLYLYGPKLGVTVGGFLMGTTFLLRIVNMMIASFILMSTTSLDDFINFFHKIKLPSEISLMLTTAIRFIPALDKKRSYIIEAQKARGAKIEKGIVGSIRSYLPIMIPLFINSIIMANSLSLAMLNRGYGLTRSMTPMREIHFTQEDYVMIVFMTIIITIALFLRIGLDFGTL